MTHPKALIYNYQKKSSFINSNNIVMCCKYNVYDFGFYSKNKDGSPFLLFRQLIYIINHLKKHIRIVSLILHYQSYLPSLFAYFKIKKYRFKLYITDCDIMSETGYGNLPRPIHKCYIKKSIKKKRNAISN